MLLYKVNSIIHILYLEYICIIFQDVGNREIP